MRKTKLAYCLESKIPHHHLTHGEAKVTGQFSVTVFHKNMVLGISAALSYTEATPSLDRQLHYQTISESINSKSLLQL